MYMDSTCVRVFRRTRVLGLVLASSVTLPWAFGSTNGCLVTSSTSVAVSGSQIAGQPIAAAGGGSFPDSFAALNAGTVPGCSAVDVTFSNFTSSGFTPDAGTDNSTTYVSTLTNQNLADGTPVDAIFSTVRGADSNTSGTADGSNNDGVNNWIGTGSGGTGGTSYHVYYEFQSSDVPAFSFAANFLGVQQGSGNGSLTGSIDLCLGGTWSFGPTTCSSGNSQDITVVNGTTSYSVLLNLPSTEVDVLTNFTLTGGTSGEPFLTSLEEDFVEPEPSTFVLLGTALAGVGFLRLRRKSA